MAFRILCVVIEPAYRLLTSAASFTMPGLIPGGIHRTFLLIQESVDKFTGIEIPYSFIRHTSELHSRRFIGIRFIGRNFTLLSCLSIFLSSILVDLLPPLYFTDDMLLLSIFGGIINGVAMTVCLRGNATTGGHGYYLDFYFRTAGEGMDSAISWAATWWCLRWPAFSLDGQGDVLRYFPVRYHTDAASSV